MHDRKSLDCLEEIVGRNMDDKGNCVKTRKSPGWGGSVG